MLTVLSYFVILIGALVLALILFIGSSGVRLI
uniref:Cytochrome b6-f complex subunit 6 n=1 Tax=Haplomitrium blumei TaxID=258993 RepID=A0A4Y5P7U1_9MARC|nr:cytochrome b6/f complex subunit VI [Haplomitrium blumei]QCW59352.1 cytochrome b6/f complex subunit VI [Haplomitrium blumei]